MSLCTWPYVTAQSGAAGMFLDGAVGCRATPLCRPHQACLTQMTSLPCPCLLLQGVFEYLHSKGIKAPEPVGLHVMVQGVVPLGGWW
jgi:hypothetical protein